MQLMLMLAPLRHKGDTIVEVLISLAVLGMIMGGAYSIANRSLAVSRQAQERSEASKIAESQIEALKTVDPATIGSLSGSFCMQGVNVTAGFPSTAATADIAADDFTDYPAACSQDNIYHFFITRTNRDYLITIRWDRLAASGREELKMIYRAYVP